MSSIDLWILNSIAAIRIANSIVIDESCAGQSLSRLWHVGPSAGTGKQAPCAESSAGMPTLNNHNILF